MFKPLQLPTTKRLPSTDGLNVNELEDVITIQTGPGYTKLRCEPSTTIKDMIAILMRTVSQSNSTKHYGLELTEKTPSDGSFRHILCPSLTWTEIKSKYNPKCLSLTICYYPTNFEEVAQSDPVTLAYLHQQVRDWYLLRFRDIENVDLAFEIGCFEICMVTQNSTLSAKDRLELFERARPLQTLFPPCVLQHYKCKALRRAIQNYLSQIYAMSQEDWTLELLNRYLILLQFDREMIPCRFGVSFPLS
ncbi:unnamed protein product [Dicrocoelium dendriticum]|nr:unnamed protein product [Dicrocoelium dendriticum]